MNIFVVNTDPEQAAKDLCDKHVVKMIVESAQMLSTAHRVLDGTQVEELSEKGRKMKRWIMEDENMNEVLYQAVHVNHPCTIWARETVENYFWLYDHFYSLCQEYTKRYEKIHATQTLLIEPLSQEPKNIKMAPRTIFPIAMKNFPECVVEDDPVASYRNYYRKAKKNFAVWNHSSAPEWFLESV